MDDTREHSHQVGSNDVLGLAGCRWYTLVHQIVKEKQSAASLGFDSSDHSACLPGITARVVLLEVAELTGKIAFVRVSASVSV